MPFGRFVSQARDQGRLVVQPRMGMSDPRQMRAGLLATRNAHATTAGTITIDSYTRVGHDAAARSAIDRRIDLNGYPIVAHDLATTRAVLSGVYGSSFPVQVRHGSADPIAIFRALLAAGLDATEGGPISYCLPYSRMPLRRSIANWAESCDLLANSARFRGSPHLETFGGCLLGQLCPPSLLVAMSILEALFFRQHGIRSISLSYAQQTSAEQDREAIAALQRIGDELLPDAETHIVIYAYMGVYPRTANGARLLLEHAATLAARSGSARLVVKTTAEAHRIPTIEENVAALEMAAAAAALAPGPDASPPPDTGIRAEATAIVGSVLELDDDLGTALATAFTRGYLDVPYCLHPDNAGRTRGFIDPDGRLQWDRTGSMPVAQARPAGAASRMTSSGLLDALNYVARRYDLAAEEPRSISIRPTVLRPTTCSSQGV